MYTNKMYAYEVWNLIRSIHIVLPRINSNSYQDIFTVCLDRNIPTDSGEQLKDVVDNMTKLLWWNPPTELVDIKVWKWVQTLSLEAIIPGEDQVPYP